MRIIHLVLGKADPNQPNGVSRIVHNIALYQHKAGFDVEVWGITKTPKKPTFDRSYNLKLFHRNFAGLFPSYSLVKELRALPRDSIFHLHGGLCPDYFAISLLLYFGGRPWVITPHGNYSKQFFPSSKLHKIFYAKLIERWVVARAALIQANRKPEISDVVPIDPDKVVFINNGLNFEEINFEGQRSSDVERPVFGYCGRLDVYVKGLDILIEAFSDYRRKSMTGQLWIIGGGEGRERLQELAQGFGISDHVVFYGFKSGAAKISVLRDFDCFIQPSRHEGMPIGPLEAAGMGLPLIVSKETNLGGDILSHNAGFVLAENTVQNLANAMLNFHNQFNNNEHLAIGRNAESMIKADFTWEGSVKRLQDEVYSRVANS